MELEPGQAIILIGVVLTALMNIGAVFMAIFKLGGAVNEFRTIGKQQAEEISELKEAVKEVSKLVTAMALQDQRQEVIEERLNRTEKTIEDLRRGEGYILSLGTHYHPPAKS